MLPYVQRCQMSARSPLCFTWLSNSLSFLSWYSCAILKMQKILNCIVSKEKESSNWTHLKKQEDQKEEWGGWEVAMFTVQKWERGGEGGFEERTWYNY